MVKVNEAAKIRDAERAFQGAVDQSVKNRRVRERVAAVMVGRQTPRVMKAKSLKVAKMDSVIQNLIDAAKAGKSIGNYSYDNSFQASVRVASERTQKMVKAMLGKTQVAVGVVYADGTAEVVTRDGEGEVVKASRLTDAQASKVTRSSGPSDAAVDNYNQREKMKRSRTKVLARVKARVAAEDRNKTAIKARRERVNLDAGAFVKDMAVTAVYAEDGYRYAGKLVRETKLGWTVRWDDGSGTQNTSLKDIRARKVRGPATATKGAPKLTTKEKRAKAK